MTIGDAAVPGQGMAEFDAKMPSMSNESGIPWLTSKDDISLSTDSMFNLHDEEVKQLLREDHHKSAAPEMSKAKNSPSKQEPCVEVTQLVHFID